jgi:hypothetical protein
MIVSMNTTPTSPPLSVQELVGDDLQKIWSDARFKAFCSRDFLAPDSIPPGSLLFVGINPSYTEADKNIRYYNAQDGQHPYFKPFKRMAADLKQPWAHFDMLFQRETEQKAIDRLLKQPEGTAFIWEQLQLARRLLDAAQPSVIIVCNTKAREFLGLDKHQDQNVWLGLNFEWDEELGTYRYQGVPVFFSSMLSGQRALDSGSHRRLIWHVKRALQAQ